MFSDCVITCVRCNCNANSRGGASAFWYWESLSWCQAPDIIEDSASCINLILRIVIITDMPFSAQDRARYHYWQWHGFWFGTIFYLARFLIWHGFWLGMLFDLARFLHYCKFHANLSVVWVGLESFLVGLNVLEWHGLCLTRRIFRLFSSLFQTIAFSL